ncbi:MAG: hypothetical protein ACD_57C00015G0001, partial [uncultured bacterium]
DMEPKMLGRHLSAIISPVKKKRGEIKNAETENKKIDS